jgi:predicted component of type VI protein secretion system
MTTPADTPKEKNQLFGEREQAQPQAQAQPAAAAKRKGGRPAQPEPSPHQPPKGKPLTEQVMQALRKLESDIKMPVMVSQVLRHLGSDIRKADFDSAVVQLIMAKKLTLVWNVPPEGHSINEYEELTVHTYFAVMRTQES